MVDILAFIAAAITIAGVSEIGKIIIPRTFPYRQYSAIGLGTVILIAILFVIFTLHLATQMTFLILFAILAILALRCRPANEIRKFLSKRSWWEYLIIATLTVLIVLHFLGASAPSIDADGLGYHMLVPDLWLEDAGFSIIEWNMYAPWPMNFELFYGAGLAFDSQYFGRYMHFLFGVLAIMLTYSFGKELYDRKAGLIAALTLYTLPMVGVLSGTSYIDLFVLYFGFLFFILCHEYARNDHKGMPLIIGLVLGAFIGSKIIGYAFSIPMGFFFLWMSWKKHERIAHVIKDSTVFLAAALVLSLPWLIKSWIMMGNPVWPFLYDVFGGQHWNEYAAQALSQEIGSGIARSALTFALFPFFLTFQSNLTGEMGFIGPLFLTLAGIACYLWIRGVIKEQERAFYTAGFVFILINLVMFFFLLHQMRYIIFLFPILAILAAGLITRMWEPRWFQKLLTVFFIITICMNLPFTLAYNGKSLAVAVGLETQDEYLTRNLDAYEPIRWINENTDVDAKIFTDGESRTFYLEREHIWGSPGRQVVIDYATIESAEDLHAALEEENITHYFTSRNAIRSRERTPNIWTIERSFIDEYCAIEFESVNGMVCTIK